MQGVFGCGSQRNAKIDSITKIAPVIYKAYTTVYKAKRPLVNSSIHQPYCGHTFDLSISNNNN